MVNPFHRRKKQTGKTDWSDTLNSKGLEPEKMKGVIKMTLGFLKKLSVGGWRVGSSLRLLALGQDKMAGFLRQPKEIQPKGSVSQRE